MKGPALAKSRVSTALTLCIHPPLHFFLLSLFCLSEYATVHAQRLVILCVLLLLLPALSVSCLPPPPPIYLHFCSFCLFLRHLVCLRLPFLAPVFPTFSLFGCSTSLTHLTCLSCSPSSFLFLPLFPLGTNSDNLEYTHTHIYTHCAAH